jgi:hypothetical protein
MYKISQNNRKYTTTPIVEEILLPNGKTEERFICVVSLPKKEGDKLSQAIVALLNQYPEVVNLITK